jgi:phosphate transport system permease protein
VTAVAPSVSRPSILVSSRPSGGRKVRNALATLLICAAFLIALVPLVAVVVWVVSKGASVLSTDFFTQDIPFTQRTEGPGMGPAIVGTIVITFGATVMAVPLGVMGGIYLNEYGGSGKFAGLVRTLAEVMTGIPSIVMGLFIYTFWVLRFKEQTGFAGALALGCLMLPIVIRTTEEMLKLVPRDLREGSFALGSRKSRTIRTIVLPHAAPGIVSGALLAVARAAGETAPLLFTIGIISEPNWNLFKGTNTALSAQIFANAASPFAGAQDRAYGAALTLILIVFIVTALARVVTSIYTRRQSGA